MVTPRYLADATLLITILSILYSGFKSSQSVVKKNTQHLKTQQKGSHLDGMINLCHPVQDNKPSFIQVSINLNKITF